MRSWSSRMRRGAGHWAEAVAMKPKYRDAQQQLLEEQKAQGRGRESASKMLFFSSTSF